MKENGIIKHDRKLASPEVEAAPDSLLQWDIATAKEVKSKKGKMTFEITIPIGDTRTAESIMVSYVHVKKAGWRINSIMSSERRYVERRLRAQAKRCEQEVEGSCLNFCIKRTRAH